MTSKMLIATDGSKFSREAADYGLKLAQKLGYEVSALYVINMKSLEMYAIGHHDDIGGYERVNDQLKYEGEAALNQIVSKGAELGVKVSMHIVRGHPADEIIKVAEQEGVELIVVGNLGKTGLEHMLMGSVSEHVVRRAPCPVLVVRGR